MSTNPWIMHVKKVRMAHPGLSYKEALQEAKKTYKRAQKGQKGTGPEHERFSSEVYEKPQDRKDVRDYKYITGDEEEGLWQSPRDIIIAYRGTVNKQDVKTDVALAAGLLKKTKRYRKSLAFAKKIKKIAKVPVITTGHSLGASLAIEVSRELGLVSWAYNPGVSPFDVIRAKADKVACVIRPKGKKCKKTKLVNIERTRGDPVSILGRNHPNVKHRLPNKLNIHSIDNWNNTMLKN